MIILVNQYYILFLIILFLKCCELLSWLLNPLLKVRYLMLYNFLGRKLNLEEEAMPEKVEESNEIS